MTILPTTLTLKRANFMKSDQTYRLPAKNGVHDMTDYGVFTQIAFMRVMLEYRINIIGYERKAKIFMLTCTE